MTQDLKKLKIRLQKIEKELDKCRTTVREDGWQTQKHAKKSRNWDLLACRKMEILKEIDEIEKKQGVTNSDLMHGTYHETKAKHWWYKLEKRQQITKFTQCESIPTTLNFEDLTIKEICTIFEWHIPFENQ